MITKEEYLLSPTVLELCELEILDPVYSDVSLNVHPLEIPIPQQCELWQGQIQTILSHIPNWHLYNNYLSISSKFFTEDSALRREGVHIDGNFCADPNFSCSTWGGTTTTWGGTHCDQYLNITTKWESPYNIKPPLGEYVSSEYGGILIASSLEGCDIFPDRIVCNIGNEGSLEHLSWNNPVRLKANTLYFMSSDTPHSSLIIPKGSRRTMIRITLDHLYPNKLIVGDKECP